MRFIWKIRWSYLVRQRRETLTSSYETRNIKLTTANSLACTNNRKKRRKTAKELTRVRRRKWSNFIPSRFPYCGAFQIERERPIQRRWYPSCRRRRAANEHPRRCSGVQHGSLMSARVPLSSAIFLAPLCLVSLPSSRAPFDRRHPTPADRLHHLRCIRLGSVEH